jgi:excisionase family DNA binding protein
MNTEDAANYLSISPRTLYELVQRGDIAPVRIPGVRRVAFDTGELKAVVDRWKAQRPNHTPEAA